MWLCGAVCLCALCAVCVREREKVSAAHCLASWVRVESQGEESAPFPPFPKTKRGRVGDFLLLNRNFGIFGANFYPKYPNTRVNTRNPYPRYPGIPKTRHAEDGYCTQLPKTHTPEDGYYPIPVPPYPKPDPRYMIPAVFFRHTASASERF